MVLEESRGSCVDAGNRFLWGSHVAAARTPETFFWGSHVAAAWTPETVFLGESRGSCVDAGNCFFRKSRDSCVDAGNCFLGGVTWKPRGRRKQDLQGSPLVTEWTPETDMARPQL
jgi:hypothetical protein